MIYLRKKTGEIIDSTYTNAKGEYILPLKNVNEDVIVTAKSTGYIPNDSILALTQNPDISRVNLNLSQKINYAFTGTVLDKLTNEKLKDVKISIVDAKTNKLISTINTNIIHKPGFRYMFIISLFFLKERKKTSPSCSYHRDIIISEPVF
jgi:hypothetical protein